MLNYMPASIVLCLATCLNLVLKNLWSLIFIFISTTLDFWIMTDELIKALFEFSNTVRYFRKNGNNINFP